MMGWTGRNRRSRERRAAWWNSLTEEERRLAQQRANTFDVKVVQVASVLFTILVFVLVVIGALKR